jgi:hypothetical protein
MGKKPKLKMTAAAASLRRIEGRKEDNNENGDETTNKIDNILPFPKSDHFIKSKAYFFKGNRYKANKLLIQGSEKGCTYCLYMFAKFLLYSVNDLFTTECPGYDLMNHKNLHLAFPLYLESAIRGNVDSIRLLEKSICAMTDFAESWHITGMYALITYLEKYYDKQRWNISTKKFMMKGRRKKIKSTIGNFCHGCGEEESDTVTLERCGRCNFYYYCSSECQKRMWLTGGHAGECRQLAILKQYHRPHGKHIRDRLVNGVDPKDIPELQELRHQLGLDRPKSEYEDLLAQVKSGHIESFELIVPNKDGTVQIGSFPRPM